jgi:hypothetical protein
LKAIAAPYSSQSIRSAEHPTITGYAALDPGQFAARMNHKYPL